MNSSPRILIVDDKPETVHLLTAHLVSAGYDVRSEVNPTQAFEQARQRPPDLVLVDLSSDLAARARVCREIRDVAGESSLPVIALAESTPVDQRLTVEEGADECLVRPYQRAELLLVVRTLLRIGSLRDRLQQKDRELRSAKALLRKQAVADPLTGLNNRGWAERNLTRQVARADRRGARVSLLILALDGLRELNEGFGHHAGDHLLLRAAGLIRKAKLAALAARYGDKRFVVILPETDRTQAQAVACRLREQLRAELEPRRPGIGLSLTVTTYPDDASDAQAMLRVADRPKRFESTRTPCLPGRPRRP